MTYAEFAPLPPLRKMVDCLWRVRGHFPDQKSQRVLPDGCIDLIFDLTGKQSPNPWWVGTMTTALLVERGGQVDFLGVRFRPGWAKSIVGGGLAEITDRLVGPADLGQKDILVLGEKILEAGDAGHRFRLLNDWLLRAFGEAEQSRSPCLDLLGALFDGRAPGAISDWSDETGMNIRRLERHVKSLTGISPRQYRSVLRFRNAVRLLHQPAARPIEVAYAAGYCDQAHFNNAFKRFSGLTPGQYSQHILSP